MSEAPEETTTTTEEAPAEGTLTQAQVDAIVKDRLARQAAQYKDYAEYKKAAERLAEIEEAQKTELERAQTAAAQYQSQLDALQSRLRDQAIQSALVQAASAAGAINPQQVVKLMDVDVELDDDYQVTSDVTGAVTAFLEANPHLVTQAPAGKPTLPPLPGNAKPAGDGTVLTAEEVRKMDPRVLANDPVLFAQAVAALDKK